MPARTRKIHHDQKTREKIRVSSLVSILQRHAEGKVEMSPSRIRAAEILLKKALPDLTATELTGADGRDLIPSGFKIEHVTSKR